MWPLIQSFGQFLRTAHWQNLYKRPSECSQDDKESPQCNRLHHPQLPLQTAEIETEGDYRGILLLIGCHDEEQEGINVFLVHIAFTCYIGHLFVKML